MQQLIIKEQHTGSARQCLVNTVLSQETWQGSDITLNLYQPSTYTPIYGLLGKTKCWLFLFLSLTNKTSWFKCIFPCTCGCFVTRPITDTCGTNLFDEERHIKVRRTTEIEDCFLFNVFTTRLLLYIVHSHIHTKYALWVYSWGHLVGEINHYVKVSTCISACSLL